MFLFGVMENNRVVDHTLMDLDLNQEPAETPVGLELGSLFTDLENAHVRIEERIRRLEAVTLRARMRQSWRQVRNSDTINNTSPTGTTVVSVDDEGRMPNVGEGRVVAGWSNTGTSCLKDSTCLVAKALEMDSDTGKNVNEEGGGNGNFFDCNLCFYMAREPILTCCGHLFCWACFFKLPYVDSTAKECPVCDGEVTDSTVIPIYGNGDSIRESKIDSGMKIPPRPKAQRVESVRQQRITRGVSNIPVAEALRRIRTSIGVMGNLPQEDPTNISLFFGAPNFRELPNESAARFRRLHSRVYSRVLSESAASLSSISSELNSTERLVEDLETYINQHLLQRSDAHLLSTDDGDSVTRNAAISQLEHQTSTEEISSVVPVPLSTTTSDGFHAVQLIENPPVSISGGLHLPPAPASSLRRRSASRALDMEYGVSQEPRRRRLN